MQTAISSLALAFVDDALALATGSFSLARHLTRDAISAARRKLSAPFDRLARACDVAGVLPAAAANRRDRFDIFGISAAFRALRDLS